MQVLGNTTAPYWETNDYEWIRFDGPIAYVGVCDFKLIGLKEIKKIEFIDFSGKIRQGDLLANILSEDYTIPIHMPVDGWFIENNKKFLNSPDSLLRDAQKSGWIAKIIPAPYTTELLSSNEYFRKPGLNKQTEGKKLCTSQDSINSWAINKKSPATTD